MKTSLISLMLLLLMAASSVMAEEEFNFLKQGYSFFDTQVGGTGGAVGLLEPLQTQNPPFAFDFVNYQVTWAYQNMTIASYSVMGLLRIWSFTGGSIGIYEDASFDLDYGVSPATGIATATDTPASLSGTISTAAFTFNVLSQTGTFSGLFHFTGGTRYGQLGNLANAEWNIFHGASSKPQVNVPPGYHSRFAGRIYVMGPTATEDCSWSQIRALY